MSAKLSWNPKMLAVFALSATVLLASSIFPVTRVGATPGSGVTGEVLASGTVQSDVSKITVIRYTIAPGGAFGWHQHSGPVWTVIQSGTLTLYSGRLQSHDPVCQGKEYGSGSAFLDPGDHTYNARNEGKVDVVVYATFMLPEGGAARIDVPGPGNCPF